LDFLPEKLGAAIAKCTAAAAVFLSLSASGATYKVDIDRPSGIYNCGEKATFTVELLSVGNLATNVTACARLDNFGTSVVTNLPFCIDTTGVTFTVSATLKEPGFLRLTLPRTLNGRDDPFVFSVGFEPEKIVKGSPSPADFDAYWAAERARLAREVPLDPQVVRVPERCTAEFEYYRISFATFGRRVYGYMSIPSDRSKAPFPVDFGVNAAGFGNWTNDMGGNKDSIRVQFSVYPFPHDWKWKENGLEAKYKAMDAQFKSKYGAGSYCHAGITESREAYFFHSVILGIDRAIDWVATRPDVDRSRFRYEGTSQGGGFGFYLCGLNRTFTRAAFYVPAITDTMGYLKGRDSGWPKIVESNSSTPDRRAAAEKWAPYFDGANFASRIKCPVRVAVGFSDTTCPPCAVYAAYNEIKSADKGIVHGIGMTHSCSAGFYKELGNWVKQSSR
jgi:cephalosporin-C deacetylase-like acetyl esterase